MSSAAMPPASTAATLPTAPGTTSSATITGSAALMNAAECERIFLNACMVLSVSWAIGVGQRPAPQPNRAAAHARELRFAGR